MGMVNSSCRFSRCYTWFINGNSRAKILVEENGIGWINIVNHWFGCNNYKFGDWRISGSNRSIILKIRKEFTIKKTVVTVALLILSASIVCAEGSQEDDITWGQFYGKIQIGLTVAVYGAIAPSERMNEIIQEVRDNDTNNDGFLYLIDTSEIFIFNYYIVHVSGQTLYFTTSTLIDYPTMIDKKMKVYSLLDINQRHAFLNAINAWRERVAKTPPNRQQQQQSSANKAAEHNDRGIEYYNKGNYDRAIAEYTEAIRLNPNLTAAYANRGVVYHEKGDYNRAITDYTEAIRLNPNEADYYNIRGIAYENKGDYDRAIADHTQAIRLAPNNADTYDWRGQAYYNKGDYDRAIADFTQQMRLEPNTASAYNWRGYAYMEKGNYRQARADVNKALQLNPNSESAKTLSEELRKKGY